MSKQLKVYKIKKNRKARQRWRNDPQWRRNEINRTAKYKSDRCRRDPEYKKQILRSKLRWKKTPKGRYSTYKRRAIKRWGQFPLTLEQFVSVISKKCYHCGSASYGIDRINNDINYDMSNIVPSCTPCNMGRHTMEIKDFHLMAHIIIHKDRRSVGHRALVSRYHEHIKNARGRKYVTELSRNEFNTIVNEHCSYCNIPRAGGIDRVDSNIGYRINNCVACCKTCNRMKYTYDLPEFMIRMHKIAELHPPPPLQQIIIDNNKGRESDEDT